MKTAEEILNFYGGNYDPRIGCINWNDALKAVQEYGEEVSEEKERRIRELEEALKDLYAHTPDEEAFDKNDDGFDGSFLKAISKAKQALNPPKP